MQCVLAYHAYLYPRTFFTCNDKLGALKTTDANSPFTVLISLLFPDSEIINIDLNYPLNIQLVDPTFHLLPCKSSVPVKESSENQTDIVLILYICFSQQLITVIANDDFTPNSQHYSRSLIAGRKWQILPFSAGLTFPCVFCSNSNNFMTT